MKSSVFVYFEWTHFRLFSNENNIKVRIVLTLISYLHFFIYFVKRTNMCFEKIIVFQSLSCVSMCIWLKYYVHFYLNFAKSVWWNGLWWTTKAKLHCNRFRCICNLHSTCIVWRKSGNYWPASGRGALIFEKLSRPFHYSIHVSVWPGD